MQLSVWSKGEQRTTHLLFIVLRLLVLRRSTVLWSWRKKKKKASEDLATGWPAIKYLGNVRNACTYVKRSCSSVVFEKTAFWNFSLLLLSNTWKIKFWLQKRLILYISFMKSEVKGRIDWKCHMLIKFNRAREFFFMKITGIVLFEFSEYHLSSFFIFTNRCFQTEITFWTNSAVTSDVLNLFLNCRLLYILAKVVNKHFRLLKYFVFHDYIS